MNVVERRELVALTLSVMSAAGTAVGLLADIPTISASPIGQAILIVIFVVAVGYLGNFLIRRIISKQISLQRCINDIEKILVDFTSTNANLQLTGIINTNEIRLIEKAKRAKSLEFRVSGVDPVEDRKFQIVIDKGSNHGLVDNMQFKVFHNSQMQELGLCPCTPFDDQATLVITIDANCPIPANDVRKETVQVHLIDPQASNAVNLLIANLLYKVDYG